MDSGSTAMNIDGSVTPAEYYLDASASYDTFVTQLQFIFADTTISNAKFGGIAALTNGFKVEWTEAGTLTTLVDEVKTGGRFIAESPSSHEAQILSGWTVSEDAQIITFDFTRAQSGGIRIGIGSTDTLVAVSYTHLTLPTIPRWWRCRWGGGG